MPDPLNGSLVIAEALPVQEVTGISLIIAEANKLPLQDVANDEATLHNLGLRFLDSEERCKGLYLRKAAIIYEAWSIHSRRGRSSKFGKWVARYTDMSLKQAHRLRAVAEVFVFGLSKSICDRMSQLPDLDLLEATLQNIKLTALYHLSNSCVPAAAREEALAEAKCSTVTPARALEIIERHTVPCLALADSKDVMKSPKAKSLRRAVEVEGGGVTIRATDGDHLKILKAAVKQLERLGS